MSVRVPGQAGEFYPQVRASGKVALGGRGWSRAGSRFAGDNRPCPGGGTAEDRTAAHPVGTRIGENDWRAWREIRLAAPTDAPGACPAAAPPPRGIHSRPGLSRAAVSVVRTHSSSWS